jgi:hypothetical protein
MFILLLMLLVLFLPVGSFGSVVGGMVESEVMTAAIIIK